MKYFLFILLFYISFINGQNSKNDSLEISLKKDYEHTKVLLSKFDQLRFANDVFLYKETGKHYTYYDRLKYDSLRIAKNNDSTTFSESMLRIRKGSLQYFFFENELNLGNHILIKTNQDAVVSVESFNYSSYSYTKKDLISKTIYSYYDGDDIRIPKYSISKYKTVDQKNDLYNIIFNKTVYGDNRTIEQNYEKDFLLSEEDILKQLPEKFLKQSPVLMKGQKFIYDYNDKNFDREFTLKEANFESKNIKSLIGRKKITLEKKYDTSNNRPFYSISIDTEPRVWEIEIDPMTGNILKLKFWGLLKD